MKKKSINLLQDRGAPPTFWERVYSWMANTCRIIVIVTEVFVLTAFGWRFYLDRKLNDLKKEIEDKGRVLESMQDQEMEIRDLKQKMGAYNQLWNVASRLVPISNELSGYVPDDVENLVMTITMEEDEIVGISMNGKIGVEELDELENELKSSDTFSNVVLNKADRTDDEDIKEFSITSKVYDNLNRPALQNEETES